MPLNVSHVAVPAMFVFRQQQPTKILVISPAGPTPRQMEVQNLYSPQGMEEAIRAAENDAARAETTREARL